MSRTVAKFRVLHALILREMITRYGISRLGYVWALLEPVGFIAMLSVLFSQIAHAPPLGKSFPLFFATGYIGFHWFVDIANVVSKSAFVNRPLFTYPAVTPLDTVIARFVLQALTGIAVGFVIFAGILFFAPDQVQIRPLPILKAFALGALLGLALGLFNVWATAVSKTWELAWNVISRPLLLISCVFFYYWSVPEFAREALWWNPIVHIVAFLREGFFPAYDNSHASPGYVLSIAGGLILAGLIGMRLAPTRVIAA